MEVAELLKEHRYSSGRPFYTVQCDECLTALNSGHHYSLKDLPHAVNLAVEHITTVHETLAPVSSERWMVVDKNRTPIFTGMFSKANAEDEARVLNESGLEEFRPYRVLADVVAESCEGGAA